MKIFDFLISYITIIVGTVIVLMLCFSSHGCSIEPQVNPVIQVVPESVLDAETYCTNLPDGSWVLVRQL